VLFYLHGFSHAETAAQLGIATGAIKTRLHKARGTLRKALWELWEEQQDMTTTTADTDTALVRVRIDGVRKNLRLFRDPLGTRGPCGAVATAAGAM